MSSTGYMLLGIIVFLVAMVVVFNIKDKKTKK